MWLLSAHDYFRTNWLKFSWLIDKLITQPFWVAIVWLAWYNFFNNQTPILTKWLFKTILIVCNRNKSVNWKNCLANYKEKFRASQLSDTQNNWPKQLVTKIQSFDLILQSIYQYSKKRQKIIVIQAQYFHEGKALGYFNCNF